MDLLESYMKEKCDLRLPGILSLSTREAYRFLNELIDRETVLQTAEMKKTLGYIRSGLIDIALKEVFSRSGVEYEIADKTSSKYKNGHTYLMIETKGAIITPAKVYKPYSVPKKALFRDRGSLLNKQYNLFEAPRDINEKYDETRPPFLVLTYGGANHQLEFTRVGLPDIGVQQWIDQVDITNSPVLLSNTDDISQELQLTFTKEAAELMERSFEDYGEETGN